MDLTLNPVFPEVEDILDIFNEWLNKFYNKVRFDFTGTATIPASGTGTFDIAIVKQTEMLTPATVWLRPSNLSGFGGYTEGAPAGYNAEQVETEFFWDFGDTGAEFTLPIVGLNIPTAWHNANVGKGWCPTHTYHTTGVKTITCLAVSPDGTYGYATVDTDSITDDPTTVYDKFISIASDHTGAPAYTTDEVATIAAAKTTVEGYAGTPKVMYMFKRDETHVGSVISGNSWAYNQSGIRWTDWGTGALPKIDLDDISLFGYASKRLSSWSEIVFESLHFAGGFNPITASGHGGSLSWSGIGGDNANVIVRCYMTGLTNNRPGLGERINDTERFSAMVECYATDYRDLGFYNPPEQSPVTNLSIVGTIIAQNPNTMPTQGIDMILYFNIRIESLKNVNLDGCYFFGLHGYLGDHGAGRFDMGGSLTNGEANLFVYRSCFEGSSEGLSFAKDASHNQKFDTCMVVGTAESKNDLVGTQSGVTFVNCYFIIPATTGPSNAAFIHRFVGSSSANDADWPFVVRDCTFVDLRSSAQMSGTDRSLIFDSGLKALYNDFTDEGNVLYIPNADTPVSVDGDLDLTTPIAGFTPYYVTKKAANEVVEATGPVAQNGTVDFSYPSGTDQAYFVATEGVDDFHQLAPSSGEYYAERGDFSVEFRSTEVRVTNLQATTWSGTIELFLDRSTENASYTGDTSFASPSTLPLPVLDVGAGGIDGGSVETLQYFDLTIREGSNHPDAAVGTPDAGIMPAA